MTFLSFHRILTSFLADEQKKYQIYIIYKLIKISENYENDFTYTLLQVGSRSGSGEKSNESGSGRAKINGSDRIRIPSLVSELWSGLSVTLILSPIEVVVS